MAHTAGPRRQPQALSPPRSSPSSTTCSILPARSSNPYGDCLSPPLPGVFPTLILARRPGFPQAFCFPPARSLCKAGFDGERDGRVSAQTHAHTYIHTHAYTQHPSAAARGKMLIPFIQARDPLAGGRGMGGVSGDHVGPGSGCRAPGWRRLPPPVRRSARPSVRPRSLPVRTARWARPGRAAAAERSRAGPPAALTGPSRVRPPPSRLPHASARARAAACGRRDTPALLQRRQQGAAREAGGKKSLPF